MKIKENIFLGKKILIYGLGKSGLSSFKFLNNKADVYLFDDVVKKHYDLTIDEKSHNADSHIHVTCKVNNNIIEINDSKIFDEIKANAIFKNFNINKLQLVVEGACNHFEKDTCKKDGTCFISTLGRTR